MLYFSYSKRKGNKKCTSLLLEIWLLVNGLFFLENPVTVRCELPATTLWIGLASIYMIPLKRRECGNTLFLFYLDVLRLIILKIIVDFVDAMWYSITIERATPTEKNSGRPRGAVRSRPGRQALSQGR